MKRITLFAAISMAATFLVPACRWVEDSEHHTEPAGLIILNAGVEILTYKDLTTSGVLRVRNGQESQPLEVVFLDESGVSIEPEEMEAESRLAWTVEDESVASIHMVLEEKYVIRVRGRSTGSTTVVIRLMHGNHDDFRTLPIPVEVVP